MDKNLCKLWTAVCSNIFDILENMCTLHRVAALLPTYNFSRCYKMAVRELLLMLFLRCHYELSPLNSQVPIMALHQDSPTSFRSVHEKMDRDDNLQIIWEYRFLSAKVIVNTKHLAQLMTVYPVPVNATWSRGKNLHDWQARRPWEGIQIIPW